MRASAWQKFFAARRLDLSPAMLAALVGVSALLELAAGLGLAYLAGWSQVKAAVDGFQPI